MNTAKKSEAQLLDDLESLRARAAELEQTEVQRKHAEKVLLENYRFVVEHTSDCVWRMNMEGRFVLMSPSVRQALGYDAEELIGESFERILAPREMPKAKQSLEFRKRGELPNQGVTLELIHQRKDGTEFIGELRTTPVFNPSGEPVEIVGITRDITERKQAEEELLKYRDHLEDLVKERTADLQKDIAERRQAEEALRESEAKFRALAETTNAATFIHRGAQYCHVNPAMQHISGYTEEELLEMNYWDLIHPDFRELVRERGQLRQRGEPVPSRYETAVLSKSGEKRWIDLTACAIELEGQPAVLGTFFDITDRKEAEETLAKSEQMYRAAIEVAGAIPYYENYVTNRYDFVGPGIQALIGYSPDEFTPEIRDSIIEEHILLGHLAGLTIEEAVEKARGEDGVSWRADFRVRTRDGKVRWMTNAAVQVRDERGKVVGSLGILQDITERKQAEEAFQKSERRYRLLAENVTDVIWTMDMNMRYTYLSPSVVGLLGFTDEEHMPKTPWEVLTPASYELSMKILAEELEIEKHEQKNPHRSRMLEIEQICADGSTIWTEVKMTFLRDENGRAMGILGVTRDLTERKRLENQLRQAQKMEAVGQLASGVAHDFNNLLTAILGNLSLAEREIPDTRHECLIEARNAANRAADLIKQLLAFSRKSHVNLRPTNMNRIVQEVRLLVRKTIDRRIDISVHTEEGLPNVLADAAQMNSILMNLCVNARDAIYKVMRGQSIPDRRSDLFMIAIDTRAATVGSGYCESHTYAHPGQFVILSVSDNGSGMDSETQRRIFEPFFTTKDVGEGTGLGLASVYGIVKQHEGWIDLHSEPGKGTTFEVYLPVSAQEVEETEKETHEEVSGGTETILFVDDEEMIRKFGKRTLEQYGYTVLLAADGQEALNVFSQERDRIDLVILDLSMPRLSGHEVLEQLRVIAPDAKVIVSSGYFNSGDSMLEEQLTPAAYVGKPYEPSNLLRTVRNVLDAH
ncbi:MAG: PAS domain S-box protein [bacterium]